MADTYGVYTNEVREVIDWAYGGAALISAGPAISSPQILIINDLARACEIANLEESDGRPDSPTSSWGIMLEYFQSKFQTSSSAAPHKAPLMHALRDFHPNTLQQLPTTASLGDFELAVEWAQDNLRAIALQRACLGIVPNSFFEDLFAAYRDGLWPCGWQDELSDPGNEWPVPGRFIAWRRSAAP